MVVLWQALIGVPPLLVPTQLGGPHPFKVSSLVVRSGGRQLCGVATTSVVVYEREIVSIFPIIDFGV